MSPASDEKQLTLITCGQKPTDTNTLRHTLSLYGHHKDNQDERDSITNIYASDMCSQREGEREGELECIWI